jgi:hypothetical protein
MSDLSTIFVDVREDDPDDQARQRGIAISALREVGHVEIGESRGVVYGTRPAIIEDETLAAAFSVRRHALLQVACGLIRLRDDSLEERLAWGKHIEDGVSLALMATLDGVHVSRAFLDRVLSSVEARVHRGACVVTGGVCWGVQL